MHVTKEQLLQDPYKTCEDYNLDPETATEADNLFCKASIKLASFAIYGDIKPAPEVIINDVWNFYLPDERQIMQEANHPFYQAWAEVTGN